MALENQVAIQQLLSELRSRIRRYVLLEGVAAVVTVLGVLFWVTFLLDLLHFQLTRLELPGWFRTACLLLMLAATVGAAVSWLVLRSLRGLRSRALALLLERRFPQFDDRLITAVELLEETTPPAPLQLAMRQRTIHQAAELSRQLDLSAVFDHRPLQRAIVLASVLAATVGLFAATNAQAMGRWVNAFIRGEADYWEPFRQQELEIFAIAQPGDRKRLFDAEGVLKHPRGQDLELVVVSQADKVAPERVSLQAVSYSGGRVQRGRVRLSPSAQGEFRHTYQRVLEDQQIWFTGGDYVNRRPFRVQIVDAPRVDGLELQCDYPTYIGRDSEEDVAVPVMGTQVSLPLETTFQLRGAVSKPLQQLQVRSPRFELFFDRAQPTGELVLIDPQTEARRLVRIPGGETVFPATEESFVLNFQVSAQGEMALQGTGEQTAWPLRIPSDTPLQITLVDADDIYSTEPALLSVNGIVDLEPVVDVRPRGVSAGITRTANIPFQGRVLDDYGVRKVWFGYFVDQNTEVQERPLSRNPQNTREYQLESSPADPVERFNVLPLQLKEGQTLTLSVYAEDGDELNGPHRGHSELLKFTIISAEELLARLYDREVNLRLRFEQIRRELGELQTGLSSQGELNSRRLQLNGAGNSAETREELARLNVGLSAFVERGLHQLRKNHVESRSVEQGFTELRDELVNNRVDTKDLLDRINGGILAPLQILNEEEFAAVDQRLGEWRLVVDQPAATAEELASTQVALAAVLERMDRILAEMRDRGTFNEFIQQLQQLIELQKKLREDTEKKRNENFFDDLGN
jgi:hypothetical protein